MIEQVKAALQSSIPGVILRETSFRGDHSLYIQPGKLISACRLLCESPELGFSLLADVTCVDWLDHPEGEAGRFEVVYNLYSIKHKARVFLKVNLPSEKPVVDSLTVIWQGANWLEREVFDLFGITFTGHPNLTKILTPDELEGHPLRRDYPLTYEVPHFTWNKDKPIEVIK